MEMGSWECIMGKVTDMTWDEDRETKGTSRGKQKAQYNNLGKNGRIMFKCATWKRTLKSQAGSNGDSLKVWNTWEYMISARF